MVDVIHDIGTGDSDYAITCVFIKNEEKCESEATWTDPIFITDIDETTDNTVNVYPNPTSGMVNVIGNGTMHITVCNLLGQKVMETKAENDTTIDLNRCESGIYIIHIEARNGISTQKITIE